MKPETIASLRALAKEAAGLRRTSHAFDCKCVICEFHAAANARFVLSLLDALEEARREAAEAWDEAHYWRTSAIQLGHVESPLLRKQSTGEET